MAAIYRISSINKGGSPKKVLNDVKSLNYPHVQGAETGRGDFLTVAKLSAELVNELRKMADG